MKISSKILIGLLFVSFLIGNMQIIGQLNEYKQIDNQKPQMNYVVNSSYFFSNNSESVNVFEYENITQSYSNTIDSSLYTYLGYYKGTQTMRYDTIGFQPSWITKTSTTGSGGNCIVNASFLNHNRILRLTSSGAYSSYSIFDWNPSNSNATTSYWIEFWMLAHQDDRCGGFRFTFEDNSHIDIYNTANGSTLDDNYILYYNGSVYDKYWFGGNQDHLWHYFQIYLNATSKKYTLYRDSILIRTFDRSLVNINFDKFRIDSPQQLGNVLLVDSLSLTYLLNPLYAHNDLLLNDTAQIINQTIYLNYNIIRSNIANFTLTYGFYCNITQLMNLSLFCVSNDSFTLLNSSKSLLYYSNVRNFLNYSQIWFYSNATMKFRIESLNVTSQHSITIQTLSNNVRYFNATAILIYPLTTMNIFGFDIDLFIELVLFVVIVGLVLYSVKQYPNSKTILGIWLILLLFYLGIALLTSELPFTVIIIIFTFLIVYLLIHMVAIYEGKRK